MSNLVQRLLIGTSEDSYIIEVTPDDVKIIWKLINDSREKMALGYLIGKAQKK